MIYSVQQLWSIALWLEKWDIQVKYAYMNDVWSQARKRIEKKRSIDEWSTFADSELFADTYDLYLQELGSPNEIVIFDFWCWTWETVKSALKKIIDTWVKVKYHAFDLSSNIIELCRSNLDSIEWLFFDATIIDFEFSNLVELLAEVRNRYNNAPVLWLLLWNTVWNFNSMERVLTNILEAMRLWDKFLIWIERSDVTNSRWIARMIQSYQNNDVTELVTSTLSELWVDVGIWEIEYIFNQQKSALEIFFIFEGNTSITLLGQTISFKIGERLRLAVSHKINEESLSKIFSTLDVRIANIRTNTSNTYLQALISPKRK